jgi:hypothetical protein
VCLCMSASLVLLFFLGKKNSVMITLKGIIESNSYAVGKLGCSLGAIKTWDGRYISSPSNQGNTKPTIVTTQHEKRYY